MQIINLIGKTSEFSKALDENKEFFHLALSLNIVHL